MARPRTSARRYAEAVFELARRDGTEDAWHIALDAGAAVLGSPDVLHIVENPAVPLVERLRAVTAALDAEAVASVMDDLLRHRRDLGAPSDTVRQVATTAVHRQLINLVSLLVERRRVNQLPAIAAEYGRLLDQHRGVVAAVVTSAAPLTADETTAVQVRVETMTGMTVSLRSEVDPALIGGLTVRVGDRLLDASVRGRLERLRYQLLAGTGPAHG